MALITSGCVPFDLAATHRRVAAQLDTLIEKGVRHAVLSAFGAAAHRNHIALFASVGSCILQIWLLCLLL